MVVNAGITTPVSQTMRNGDVVSEIDGHAFTISHLIEGEHPLVVTRTWSLSSNACSLASQRDPAVEPHGIERAKRADHLTGDRRSWMIRRSTPCNTPSRCEGAKQTPDTTNVTQISADSDGAYLTGPWTLGAFCRFHTPHPERRSSGVAAARKRTGHRSRENGR